MSRIYPSWRRPRRRPDGLVAATWPRLALGAALCVALVQPAAAYVGPGAGLGAIGAFIGLVATVLLTVGLLIVWPVRRLLRRARGKPAAQAPASDDASADPPDPPPGQ